MKWKKKGHEFDEYARVICNPESKYYIWGAGTFGESFYSRFQAEVQIEGFIDSNPQKQGTLLCGVPVASPEYLKEKSNEIKVLVSAGWTREIFQELEKMGYEKGRNYFHIDEFSSVYMMYHHKKLFLENIGYVITEKCTLRCKNCLGMYPYYKDAKNIPTDKIKEDIDNLFRWVDQINVFAINGGDAMLHPQFAEILEYLGESYYGKKICDLEVYTNAILMPNQTELELMKKYHVFYRFTDYGVYTSSKQKIDEIKLLLKDYGIRYDHVKFVSWYDTGYFQENNGIKEEKLVDFCAACDRRSCQLLFDHKVFYCGTCHNADRMDYCRIQEEDFFSLESFEEEKKIELMEYMLGYSQKGYYEYCKKCNGGQNVNSKKIEAGVQL